MQKKRAGNNPERDAQQYVPESRQRVLFDDPRNLQYWAGRFDVSVEQLRAAIEVWGDELADLRLLLDLGRPQPEDPPTRSSVLAPGEGDYWTGLLLELIQTGRLPFGAGDECREAREFLMGAARYEERNRWGGST